MSPIRAKIPHAGLPGTRHPRRPLGAFWTTSDRLQADAIRGNRQGWKHVGGRLRPVPQLPSPLGRRTWAALTDTEPFLGHSRLKPDSNGWSPGFSRLLAAGELESACWLMPPNICPSHLGEVRLRKEALIDKTKAAVHERLTKEINYWDHRANQLKEQEIGGQGQCQGQLGACSPAGRRTYRPPAKTHCRTGAGKKAFALASRGCRCRADRAGRFARHSHLSLRERGGGGVRAICSPLPPGEGQG